MNVDVRGRDAASALLIESVRVDTDLGLVSLRRLHRRRSAVRRTAGLGAALLMLVGVWAGWPPGYRGAPPPSGSSSSFPPLGEPFEVVQTDVSPSGHLQAVAALRDGESAVVLVREAGDAGVDFVWSAPTPHERANQNPQSAVAVDWSPDERRLAILVAQERGTDHDADLTLLTMNPDGTDRRLVEAVLVTCACADLPSLEWSPDGRSIQVEVPTRTGPISNQVEVS